MNREAPPSDEKLLSIAIIEAVAEQMGVSPLQLPEKLYTVIDPEALDTIFANKDRVDGTISFVFCGHRVTATPTGDVSVEEEEE